MLGEASLTADGIWPEQTNDSCQGQSVHACMASWPLWIVICLIVVLADTELIVGCLCRANAQQPKLFVGMILILIFAEALALYGLIGEHICTGPNQRAYSADLSALLHIHYGASAI